MRDTILELADQRQARSLLTAFSIKDSLKNDCPFPLQRNPTRGYLYAVRNTAKTMKGAETN